MKRLKPAIDPIVLATTTAGLAAVAAEAGRSDASQAIKEMWADCSNLFSWWTGQPPPEDMVIQMAQQLHRHPALVRGILYKLRLHPDHFACKLVARIECPRLTLAEAQPKGTP